MSVAKVIEISSSSPESFEHAIVHGIERATSSLDNVRGAWIKEQSVVVDQGKVKEFRVDLKVTFVIGD